MNERKFSDIANVEHYIDRLDPCCNHIEVSVLSNAVLNTGFGSDTNKDKALFKAVSEFFERLAFKEIAPSGCTSNGFAGHNNTHSARVNAMCELIERDLLTSFWLLKKPPVWIQEESYSLELKQAISLFSDKGFKLDIGVLGKTGDVFTLISKMSTAEGGIVINASSSLDFYAAVTSLIYDNSRAATVIINRMESNDPVFTEISSDRIIQPRDAFEFYLNPVNGLDLKWLFTSSDDVFYEKMPTISFEEIDKFSIMPPWRVVVCRAMSPSLQEFYVGVPLEQQINYARLRKIVPNFQELNLKPHPLA